MFSPHDLSAKDGIKLPYRFSPWDYENMSHSVVFRIALVCLLALLGPAQSRAQQDSGVVIWWELGLPAADSGVATSTQLAQIFPDAHLTVTDQLAAQLGDQKTQLLILPQGSAVPETSWDAIYRYLRRGGNLLVLGGRPFTRAAYHDNSGWHLRDDSVRFLHPLLMDQYQTTPGSEGETFVSNPDIPVQLPKFRWQRAFSPVIRLSANDVYHRGGSTGYLDARLDPLVWGEADGRRMAVPIQQIDHISSGFDGGRWIFLTADLAPDFYSSPDSSKLLRTLALRALEGALDFAARPSLPLYLPGEPVELETTFHSARKPAGPVTVQVTCYPQERPAETRSLTIPWPASSTALLPAPSERGLHIMEARLMEGSKLLAIYHSAFWIRDEDFLRSGSHLSVNADYFLIDGKPLAVVGTTYMSSEVQRLYFDHPNVYVWNRDMAQIHQAGLNMIRTGWWTGWDKLCDETGRPYERTLRTLEAYLMTARKYDLPVQFNFFAFLPDVFGGANAFLDPEAVRRQQNLVSSVAARFRDVPFLAWDLINEPSFSTHLWTTRPNGDWIEKAAWNDWLEKRYPDHAALAAAWNLPVDAVQFPVSLPSDEEFSPQGMYGGVNSLRVYDYYLFAQEKFAEWVHSMGDAIRATGATQPITVGQDEGGNVDRLSPAFFAPFVDFTTSHSWWQNDALLWDSLTAKQPGLPMLVQETGVQRELTFDELPRRTPEQEAMLFERKFVLSFVQGSGAIEWLWNTNSYMTESGETPIGAARPDGTEKPEAAVLRNLAKFAAAASPYLQNPKPPEIAVVTSQVAQYSVWNDLQITAQRNAVRALSYNLHLPCYMISENEIARLGTPRLVILPSVLALRENTWQALLVYVKNGGNLLVSGPAARDEHWRVVDRLSPLGMSASLEPLTMHSTGPSQATELLATPFDQQKQLLAEYWKFADGSRTKEIAIGKGKLLLGAYPVELSDDPVFAAQAYAPLLTSLAIQPPFKPVYNVFSGVLIYPVELRDSVLYILESETDLDSEIDLKDAATGAQLRLRLPAERGALALIDKKTRKVVAQYGF
jgi:hypothetical protein